MYLKVAPAAAATELQKPAHRTKRGGSNNTLHLSKKTPKDCFMSLKHRAITLDVILRHFNFKYGDNTYILAAFTFHL